MRPLRLAAALLLAAAAVPAPAAASEFRVGDLYYTSNAFAPGLKGLRRVDPTTGAVTLLLPFASVHAGLAYDPWRDRLVTSGQLQSGESGLWAVDASGNPTLLDPDGQGGSLSSSGYLGIAPTGDGRIYLSSQKSTQRKEIRWLDAAGAMHVLLDETGLQPFSWDTTFGSPSVNLVWDAPSRSLIAGLTEGSYPCTPGGDGLNFWRVPLSLDGTRVAGPLECASYVASPTKQDWLRGFSRGPAGEILFGVWNNGGLDTRLVLLDPSTLAFQTYSGAPGGQSPAVYSRTRGLAAVLDTGNDTIAWYGPGTAAPGSVFATSGVSPSGSSSEAIGWTEIDGAWSNAGLTTATDAIGLSSGGTQVLSLDAGPARAGALYVVLGSLTGWHPGFALGAWSVPIQVDDYTLFTLNEPSTFPLAGSFGALDAQGKAQASFSLPPLNLPGLVGLRWWHAAVVPGANAWVSNPIELVLAP